MKYTAIRASQIAIRTGTENFFVDEVVLHQACRTGGAGSRNQPRIARIGRMKMRQTRDKGIALRKGKRLAASLLFVSLIREIRAIRGRF